MLLHGIVPRPWTFVELRRALAAAGYNVVVFSYPSTRRPISAHAAQLERLLDRFEDSDTVSFVSHSMGGLVLRELLARDGAWRDRIAVGRMVMIAPPNRGSAIARMIRHFTLYRWLYGPAGQELTPQAARRIPGLDGEFAIIAGGDRDEGYNPLLAGDDDGTVSVAETRLEGARDFLVVDNLHSSLPNDPRVVGAVLGFFETGEFEAPDTVTAGGATK